MIFVVELPALEALVEPLRGDGGRAYVVLRAAWQLLRADALSNHDGVRVLDVRRDEIRLRLTVETPPDPVGCARCGVAAVGHGRRLRRLHDFPAFGAPVDLFWRVRRLRCPEPTCEVGVFTEEHQLARPREEVTSRAAWWG